MPAPYLKDDEEDFRSRYSRETAGMPANLAAVASRNLAAADDSLAKVNAVSRFNTALPAPGSPFATPETDAANFSIADAMDRADLANRSVRGGEPTIADLHTDDISQRRSAISEQKKTIMARLGIIQPRDAGLAAVVIAGPKERKDLIANWQILEKEEDNLIRERHYNAIDSARTSHEKFAREKHADAASDFSNLAGRLLEIRKSTKRGTSERAEAILKAAQDFPAGFRTESGQIIIRQMSQEQDAAAALTPPGYEKVPSSIGAGGNLSYDVKPKGTTERLAVEAELKEKYGLTPAQIKAPANIESGNVDKDGNFVNANKGTHFRVTTKEGQFQIPRAEFEAFGGHIGEADKLEPNAPAPTPSVIPPAPERKKDAVYETPRGKMKWTGTGWVQP